MVSASERRGIFPMTPPVFLSGTPHPSGPSSKRIIAPNVDRTAFRPAKVLRAVSISEYVNLSSTMPHNQQAIKQTKRDCRPTKKSIAAMPSA
jgi:hypothetical protein